MNLTDWIICCTSTKRSHRISSFWSNGDRRRGVLTGHSTDKITHIDTTNNDDSSTAITPLSHHVHWGKLFTDIPDTVIQVQIRPRVVHYAMYESIKIICTAHWSSIRIYMDYLYCFVRCLSDTRKSFTHYRLESREYWIFKRFLYGRVYFRYTLFYVSIVLTKIRLKSGVGLPVGPCKKSVTRQRGEGV